MTHTPNRYPVHLIDVVRVADGSRITIRPTMPQDVELLRAFFRTLSAESRYGRFMTPLRELPYALAERFTNIDYRRHLALLAEVFDEAGQETMIGDRRTEQGDQHRRREPCRPRNRLQDGLVCTPRTGPL